MTPSCSSADCRIADIPSRRMLRSAATRRLDVRPARLEAAVDRASRYEMR